MKTAKALMEARPVFRLVRKVLRIIGNPWIHMVIGFLVLTAGMFEVIETFHTLISDFKVHAGHGVVLAGLSQMVRSATDLVERVEKR